MPWTASFSSGSIAFNTFDGAGVLAAATFFGVGCTAVVVIVVAARGEQHHDDGGYRHQSPESHRGSPLLLS